MLASVGDLPDTIMDRAIVIRMRRRAPDEKITPFRTRRDNPPLRALRGQLRNWIRPRLKELTDAVPALPVEDRAADTWEPLFVIAELAGGDWPDRAKRACLALATDELDDGTDTRLLADLYAVWGNDEDYIFTATILTRLHNVEESPWSEWGPRNEPLTPRGLASLLKPYGVKPRTVRVGEVTAKGYAHEDLADALTRYVTSVTTSQDDDKPDATTEDGRDGYVTDSDSESVTRSDQREQSVCDTVTLVTDQLAHTQTDRTPVRPT